MMGQHSEENEAMLDTAIGSATQATDGSRPPVIYETGHDVSAFEYGWGVRAVVC